LEKLLSLTNEKGILKTAVEAGFHNADCPGHDAVLIDPYFWFLVLYGATFVIISIALMIYDTSRENY